MNPAIRMIRAFSTELQKIAAKVQDADIQKLLAEREGKEYLDGGRLATNTMLEAEYAQKMAGFGGYSAPVGLSTGAGINDVLKSKTKKDNDYQKVRDYAGTGMKGGLTGLGVLGATNAMRGRFGAPVGAAAIRHAAKSARRAAGIGATAAIADRAYRHDDLPGEKKAFVVGANPNTPFRSPAASLSESRATGSFKNVIHDAGKASRGVQLGTKFRLP